MRWKTKRRLKRVLFSSLVLSIVAVGLWMCSITSGEFDFRKYLQVAEQKDLFRFYKMKIISFFHFVFSWGWLVIGVPIPIVPPTTRYNLIFSIRFYGTLFLLLIRTRNKLVNKLMLFFGILFFFGGILSLEYE